MKTFVHCLGPRWSHETDGHDFIFCSPGSLYQQARMGVAHPEKTVVLLNPWVHWNPEADEGFTGPGTDLPIFWGAGHLSYGYRFGGRHVMRFVAEAARYAKEAGVAGVMLDDHHPSHSWWLAHGTETDVYNEIHGGPVWYRRLLMLWMEGALRRKLGGKLLMVNGPPRLDLPRLWETACGDAWHRDQARREARAGDWAWCGSGREEDWREFIRHFGNEPNIIIGCGYPDGINTDPMPRAWMESCLRMDVQDPEVAP